jgi:dihydropteroate synthase
MARGCRILRVHDVAGTVRVRDVVSAIMSSS